MGMDVYGIEPRNADGQYFRANCWSWRPICVALEKSGAIDHIPVHQQQLLAENSGGGARSRTACLLMARDLDSWIKEAKHAKGKPVRYSPTELDDICRIAQEPSEHGGYAFVDEEDWDTVPTQSAYQVDWDHLEEFVTFLRACGDGFEVW